jgi:hypothetical protein
MNLQINSQPVENKRFGAEKQDVPAGGDSVSIVVAS